MHECEEFVSQCCGAERHEYVDTICAQCHEHTGFECIECSVLDGIAAKRGDFPVSGIRAGNKSV